MPNFKKNAAIVLISLVAVLSVLGNSYAARKHVVISEQSWTGSTVIVQVMKYVLEEKLHVPVKVTQLNGAVAWVGMDKGDVDVYPDLWESGESAGIEKYVNEKKSCEIVLSYPDAPQAFFIPKYVVEKYGIKTIEDLKGQEKIFDIDSDGKGDLWGGPTSWKTNEICEIKNRDYGLDFHIMGVEQWAWLATLKAAYAKKKPVIFYYWAPEWLFSQYELVAIREPAYEDTKWHYIQKSPEKSNITCQFKPTNVWVGISKQLEKRVPNAYKMLNNWTMPIDEVSNLIAMVTDLPDNPKMNAPAAAKKWVETHPEIVGKWLEGIE